jgi:putative hydrolase
MSSARNGLPTPDQDMHVHSTYSDGAGTVAENLIAAEGAGLAALTCVDHVRADTDWAPEFAEEVRSLATGSRLDVKTGLEAKIMDTSGELDLPPDTGGVDRIYAADHRVPLDDGPADPAAIRLAIADGERDPSAVLESIVTATANAVERHPNLVIAHLFSVLPKIGLVESSVRPESLERLANAAAANGASIEIDERWRCPSARTLRVFHRAGVPILLSTDSHSPETIGRYHYCLGVIGELAA